MKTMPLFVGIGLVTQLKSASPTLFAALEDQLGLKLERSDELVEFLIIDSVEPLTEN